MATSDSTTDCPTHWGQAMVAPMSWARSALVRSSRPSTTPNASMVASDTPTSSHDKSTFRRREIM